MKKRKFKHIALRVALFAIILFTLDRSIGFILLTLADNVKDTGSMGMVNKIFRSDARVYVLGSSRAAHQFDSDILANALGKKVYNAGRDGVGLSYSRFAADLIYQDKKPELIILQIEPQNLMNACYYGQTVALTDNAPYLCMSDKTKELLFSKSKWFRLKYLSHTFRFNGQFLFFIADLPKKDSIGNGYIPLHKTTDISTLNEKQYTRARSYNNDASPEAFGDLRELIQLIKAKGSKVVMVSSPRWRKDYTLPEVYYEIADMIQDLANRENVPYLQVLQETHPEFKDPALFADASHLNYKGSEIFSQIVAEFILSETGAE